jgi:hypothetical protein
MDDLLDPFLAAMLILCLPDLISLVYKWRHRP